MGAAEGIALLLELLDRASAWGAVVQKAQNEKRDLTAAEVDSFSTAAAVSEAKLQAAIDKAKAAGH